MNRSELATYNVLLLQESSASYQYATWTGLDNMIAENDGVTKNAGAAGWNADAITDESFSTGGGIKTALTAANYNKQWMLQLYDSDTVNITYTSPSSGSDAIFSIYCTLGDLVPYYTFVGKGTQASLSEGDTVELRENTGAIEVLHNDSVVYTFAESPAALIKGRVVCYTASSVEIPSIELTGGVWS